MFILSLIEGLELRLFLCSKIQKKARKQNGFWTFRENLARDIKETLEARSGSDFEVEHRTAEKMNGNYEPDFTPANQEDKLITATNKWLLAHAESFEAKDGAWVGITGENIDIADDI